VLVYPGASKPLLGPVRHDSEIHGVDGLEGVEGLPNSDHPEVRKRFALDKDGNPVRALEGMAGIIRETWKQGTGEKVTIVSTGPTTNIGVCRKLPPQELSGEVSLPCEKRYLSASTPIL
jgi:uridine nucleosidase